MASPPTTPTSQASTKVGRASTIGSDESRSGRRRALERIHQATTARDILIFLIAFRVVNALSVKTFFQPDEYFQSLEPAWQMAFGTDSGAWITWEWKHRLRSAIHPAIFAAVYRIAATASQILRLPPTWHADLLIVAPKLTQAVSAALGDYYTWKLAERTYGGGSYEAWATLAMTVCNPWQWFCSTRTFSNCLEMTLTTIALNYWPWEWSMNPPMEQDRSQDDENDDDEDDESDHDDDSIRRSIDGEQSEELGKSAIDFWDDVMHVVEGQNNLRLCLVLAALACVLRPTNILIWLCIVCFSLFRIITYGKVVHLPWTGTPLWLHVSDITFIPGSRQERYTLFRESIVCGFLVLLFSLLVDRLYFTTWTFPPLNFLYFNIVQSLAIFYGRNRRDYYFTEGLPLLLTTFLPFAIVGIYRALFPPDDSANPAHLSHNDHQSSIQPSPLLTRKITNQLASVVLFVSMFLSIISHKEVRFIYPLLPALHVLASGPLVTFFLPILQPERRNLFQAARSSSRVFKRILLFLLLASNVFIAFFTTTFHQPSPLAVLSYLRHQHVSLHLSQPPRSSTKALLAPTSPISMMTVGFLTPCHSTPWRSHLIFPTIKAWALSCDPPLHLNKSSAARDTYLDEADQFYADPRAWLLQELGAPPPPLSHHENFRIFNPSSWLGWLIGSSSSKSAQSSTVQSIAPSTDPFPPGLSPMTSLDRHVTTKPSPAPALSTSKSTSSSTIEPWNGSPGRKSWPEYLVFFEQLEPVMRDIAGGGANTHGTSSKQRNGKWKSGYTECWRGFNSYFHDDWRRRGDVVVWCLRRS